MPEITSESETFVASRWTAGNHFFPARITVTPEHVLRVKPRVFGSDEESIAIAKVASVHIKTGLFFSEIVIESSGGVDPIVSKGHRKADAKRIREKIEHFQARDAAARPDTAKA
jgi:hypothetical protein